MHRPVGRTGDSPFLLSQWCGGGQKTPFRPFRFYLSNGAFYDSHHQDFMLVSQKVVAVALELGKGGVRDRLAYVDPVHITHIEPLDGSLRYKHQLI